MKKYKKTLGYVELDIKYWCIFDFKKGGGIKVYKDRSS